MSPPKLNTVLVHFTHPGHQLVKHEAKAEYICDGCKTHGTGAKYRCSHHPCDFDLHEYCATCPRSLSSFLHPHPLSLVVHKAQATGLNQRTCNVCAETVGGLFYRCSDCKFDVHPLCTQLPQDLRHILHPMHPLTLQVSTPSWCMVCGGACASWRYGCDACSFNIHLKCVILACDASTRGPTPPSPSGTSHSIPTFGTRPPPFGAMPPSNIPYGALPYGVPAVAGYQYPGNMYNFMYPGPTNTHNNYGNHAQAGGAPNKNRKRKSTFGLPGKQAAGVLSNVVFGVDLISPFL